MKSARGWGAASTGIGNAGEALLRELALKKEQENAAADLALRQELGRGNLDLGREELGFRRGESEADRSLRAAMAGYEDPDVMGGQSIPNVTSARPVRSEAAPIAPDIFEGRGIGMAGGGSNPGAAALRLLSPRASASPPRTTAPSSPRYVYNKGNHGDALMQDDQQAFLTGENVLDRTLTSTEGAADRGNRIETTRMGETGANSRNVASISSNERIAVNEFNNDQDVAGAKAEAVTFLEKHGNDFAAALGALQGDNSVEAQLIRREIQALKFERGRRSLMGIGGGSDFGSIEDIENAFR